MSAQQHPDIPPAPSPTRREIMTAGGAAAVTFLLARGARANPGSQLPRHATREREIVLEFDVLPPGG